MSEANISEVERLTARVAELEAELAAKPPIGRAALYQLADATPWGVVALSLDGKIDYANPAMARWMSAPAPATGLLARDVIAPALLNLLMPALGKPGHSEPLEVSRTLRDSAGEARNLRVTCTPRFGRPGLVTGAIINVHDITEAEALALQLSEAQSRIHIAMDAGRMAVWEYDVRTAELEPNEALGRLLGYPAGALPSAASLRAGFDPTDWQDMAEAARIELARGVYIVEAELRHSGPDGEGRTLLLRLEMLRDAAGDVVKGHGVLVDITERKSAERALRLLVNELNHRVKNTLAVVQAMARGLKHGSQSPEREEFENRLMSLAAAHDVLTAENWAGADLGQVVKGALALAPTGRAHSDGPPTRLSPKLALSLAMALHELLTNAQKHGALSAPGGSVSVVWSLEAGGLTLVWREAGGPPVSTPTRRGFGTRLLLNALPRDMAGSVTLEFEDSGLLCRIVAPLEASLA